MTSDEVGTALHELAELGRAGPGIGLTEVRLAIARLPALFRTLVVQAGGSARSALALTTKFRDAGRRSPPWQPVSSRVPGRPQDGSDGNRITRSLLPDDHKFYADERTATLVEIRYYLQALSMKGAPDTGGLLDSFIWLTGHPVSPGQYRDPLQLIDIDFGDVVSNPRIIQSGHFIPLNRGGKHQPDNTFLTLARSNQLQGDMTVDELLSLIATIVQRHNEIEGRAGGDHMPPKQLQMESDIQSSGSS